ncbi:MAG: hypothetical protein M5U28_43220 [Sandaracinaceae bacterium]|nr:hypothetical protein [Sandaracinaceae bacterium]
MARLCSPPEPEPAEHSPIGWHLGHVGFTEAQWILLRCGGDDRLVAPFARRWARLHRRRAGARRLPQGVLLRRPRALGRARGRIVAVELEPAAGARAPRAHSLEVREKLGLRRLVHALALIGGVLGEASGALLRIETDTTGAAVPWH